jgi:hypothetical protein
VAAVKQSRKIASQDISVNHTDEMANRVGLFFWGLFSSVQPLKYELSVEADTRQSTLRPVKCQTNL